MRNTIKKHMDFAPVEDALTARSAFFLVRTKPAKFPDDPRYGLIVTKKTFRHAVQRNLVKRKLRDWIAFSDKYMHPDMDYIFLARPPMLDATREDGRTAMIKALRYIYRTHAGKK